MDEHRISREAIHDYEENKSKSDLLEKIKSIDIDCWQFYYNKSDAIYSVKHDYKKALIEIKKALHKHKVCMDDKNENFSNYINLIDSCPRSKNECDLYYLAGQLFAENNNQIESLNCYQKYQFYSRTKSSFSDKESIIVYSFRRYNEHSLSDLINNTITVCHPSMMNDPFDTLIFEWKKNLQNICTEKKHIEPYKDSFDSYKIRSFVANCETMENDDSIVSDILMWSHYADSHKGFCLKYRLSKSFFDKWDEKKLISQRLRKVEYKQEKVSVNTQNSNTTLGYTTKSGVWAKENEVRLIYYNPFVNSSFYGVPLKAESQIEAVYFGIKMDEQNKKTIKNILRRKKVEYYDMKNDIEDVYNIKPKEIIRNKKK